MRRKQLQVFRVYLLLTVLSIFTTGTFAQGSDKGEPVANALKKVTKAFGTQFVFDPQLLAGKSTSYDLGKLSGKQVEEVLKAILYPHDLVFLYVKTNYYTIVPKDRVGEAAAANAGAAGQPNDGTTVKENVSISGKVTDESSQPLIGASVKVKGAAIGTQTGQEGNFSINAPNANSILLFSFVGYDDLEVNATGQTNLSVQLKAKANAMEQVVVVGYGTQRKSDVTGAVSSANLEDFRNSPNTNIAQSLQGTVPGLNIGQVTSAGSTPSISIRGANTLNGNRNVLIILDGVQYNSSLESINPDDIASIDVLKDASSTAVYGAQAANGVLLITTRKGRKGDKPRISFSSSYATQTPTVNLRPMEREQYLDHVRDLYYNEAYLAPDYTQPNPAFNLAARVDPAMKDASGNIVSTNFDWWKEATNTGYINENQLSISGGGERFTYLFSGGFTNQSGFIVNDKFKRKTLRMNLEAQATTWWKVGIQSFGSFVNKDGAEPNISTIIQQSPLIEPYDAEGKLKPFPFNTNFSNPFLTYDVDDYERNNYLFANIYSNIDFPFLKGLSYRVNFGNNYRINQHNEASEYGAGLTGSASKESNHYYDYTFDNILTYSKRFGEHDITATLLYGAIERKSNFTSATANGFSRLTLGYNSLEQGANQFTYSDAWSEALNYQMARLNYKYADKYLLTTTIRRDGFSGFASNHKYGYFPSVALGWVVTQESFFQPAWVDFLKVRAGYGISGNQTSRYNSLAGISGGASYIFGDGGSTVFGQQVSSLANPDLSWEKTAGLNVGLDFRLFKGRINGSFDYYNNKTNDLLFSVNLPVITGFGSINTNLGELQNKGLELSLTSLNVDLKNFRWTSTLNVSRNTNKIVELLGQDNNGDGKEDDLIASNLFIGRSISTLYDYQINGIYQPGETIPAGYSIGTYRVVDLDKNGTITPADRSILARQEPSYRVSLLNSFDYKGFTLTVFLNSIQGGLNGYRGSNSPVIIRDDNAVRYNYLSAMDYWSPTNRDAKYPQSIVAAAVSPANFQDRSFIRLQDVSLSYRFTGGVIKRMKIQNLNLYVSGKNLATWTNWEGWDPETNQGLTINGRPVMKGVAVGLNLTF
jgi:TonB-linked SusC/RagA family outer membrane protein